MIGQTLSHYRILEKLGEGAMGMLYRALDTRLDRSVAIKVLRPEAVGDVSRKRRFVQEAKAASALNHPNIITVYDIGQATDGVQGVDFIAMEYVDGQTLAAIMSGRRLPVGEALGYAVQVAEALAAAHLAGIVHRDVKPANIMVSCTGQVKVLDFGIAKLTERAVSEATPTVTAGGDSLAEVAPPLTRQGAFLGTPAYMSPEQADGKPVDARSDVFSFGAVLYEMLAGRRPFEGDSPLSSLTAMFRDPPPPLSAFRPDVPRDLERIVQRCLAKDRDARYPSARELLTELAAARAHLSAPGYLLSAALRRPRNAVAVAMVVLAIAGLGAWWWTRSAGPRWARDEVLPEIARLVEKEDDYHAFILARQAQAHLPGNAALQRFWSDHTFPFTLETDPPGAEVLMKPYRTVDAPWDPLGRTPLKELRLPLANLRLRIEKEGFEPVEVATDLSLPLRVRRFTLDERGKAPNGMVHVPGGRHQYRSLPSVEMGDFWLDRYEVTNRQYKEFVDQGGYRNRGNWKEPFVKDGRVLSWEEAMALFRDSTGRPGPAIWELGTYPEGQADHPVGGVSWFEAAAYAGFAGKELPTFHHWTRAAGLSYYSDILLLSNFGGRGPSPAGSHQGLSPFGVYDMAGNVKEWCWNATGAKRYILGGGWNEPTYMFADADAQSPWDRSPSHGFRCAKYPAALPPGQLAAIDVMRMARDYAAEKPVPDDVFRVYRSFYSYDRTELKPAVESLEGTEHWRREKVSFDAAYGSERVTAHLFLPRNASPPYQTVVYVPSGEALRLRSSDELRMKYMEFLLRSGRAVMHPIYKGTYERRLRESAGGPGEDRDLLIQISKDLGRSIDYLETRADIDRERLAYYGVSLGADVAPLLLAIEGRFRVAVLQGGGLEFSKSLPEGDPFNFAPRVSTPVLMLNGRDDFERSLETSQRPLFRLLASPERDKRHVLFESGHAGYPMHDLIKEVLDWLDRYLGPVKNG
jgi:formylglycine-generating enzyme required for sulfatase activity